MAKILVVEDETDLQQVLGYNLRGAGHEVLAATTGAKGLELARQRHPELVLLDLMLPDLLGTEVCRTLRSMPETEHVRIIMLTAKGEEADRVGGLQVGADDYVVKPFSVRELLLRVEAVLRRGPTGADESISEFGVLRIERDSHRVLVGGSEVELTSLEFRLLVTLFERRDRVQTRSRLLDDVWGMQPDLTTRTVDTHIKRLREKLGIARDYVETVRGVGYRFVASPTETVA